MGAVKNWPKINVSQCHPQAGRQWTKEPSRACVSAFSDATMRCAHALCVALSRNTIAQEDRSAATRSHRISRHVCDSDVHEKHVNHIILEVKVERDEKSKSLAADERVSHLRRYHIMLILVVDVRRRGREGFAAIVGPYRVWVYKARIVFFTKSQETKKT